eukprot:Opistho-2@30132
MDADQTAALPKKIGATRRPYCVWTCPCRPEGWIYRERGLFHRHCHVVHPDLNLTSFEDITGPYTPQRRQELAHMYKMQPKAKPSASGGEADFKAGLSRPYRSSSDEENNARGRKRRSPKSKTFVDEDDDGDSGEEESKPTPTNKRRRVSTRDAAVGDDGSPSRQRVGGRRGASEQAAEYLTHMQTPEEMKKVFLVTQALLSFAGGSGPFGESAPAGSASSDASRLLPATPSSDSHPSDTRPNTGGMTSIPVMAPLS